MLVGLGNYKHLTPKGVKIAALSISFRSSDVVCVIPKSAVTHPRSGGTWMSCCTGHGRLMAGITSSPDSEMVRVPAESFPDRCISDPEVSRPPQALRRFAHH